MGRSNNQRRRTMKDQGKTFIPAWTKSKTKRVANKQKLLGMKKAKKLSYNKVVNKSGTTVARKFKSGGYNNSGKFGKAQGNAARAGKKMMGRYRGKK